MPISSIPFTCCLAYFAMLLLGLAHRSLRCNRLIPLSHGVRAPTRDTICIQGRCAPRLRPNLAPTVLGLLCLPGACKQAVGVWEALRGAYSPIPLLSTIRPPLDRRSVRQVATPRHHATSNGLRVRE